MHILRRFPRLPLSHRTLQRRWLPARCALGPPFSAILGRHVRVQVNRRHRHDGTRILVLQRHARDQTSVHADYIIVQCVKIADVKSQGRTTESQFGLHSAGRCAICRANWQANSTTFPAPRHLGCYCQHDRQNCGRVLSSKRTRGEGRGLRGYRRHMKRQSHITDLPCRGSLGLWQSCRPVVTRWSLLGSNRTSFDNACSSSLHPRMSPTKMRRPNLSFPGEYFLSRVFVCMISENEGRAL